LEEDKIVRSGKNNNYLFDNGDLDIEEVRKRKYCKEAVYNEGRIGDDDCRNNLYKEIEEEVEFGDGMEAKDMRDWKEGYDEKEERKEAGEIVSGDILTVLLRKRKYKKEELII
jgi:hypothetical protein